MKRMAKVLLLLVYLAVSGIGIRAENGYTAVTICTGKAEPVCTLYRIDEDGTKKKLQELRPYSGEISMRLEYGEYEIPAVRFQQEDGMYETIPMHFHLGSETDHITMYLKYEKIVPEPLPVPVSPDTGDAGVQLWMILSADFAGLAAVLLKVRRKQRTE